MLSTQYSVLSTQYSFIQALPIREAGIFISRFLKFSCTQYSFHCISMTKDNSVCLDAVYFQSIVLNALYT